ncbi:MAG: hypothetical protein K1X79_01270 [Oligoflexia bacterium]|nr:hypothetical protein [Oligoflexia bacterium]
MNARQILLSAALLAAQSALPGLSRADGQEASSGIEQRQASVAHAPRAVDKRMPPVVPGQAVNDGKKDMNVWSTSGPVPISEPPQALEPRHDRGLAVQERPSEIIVDTRKQPAAPSNPQ